MEPFDTVIEHGLLFDGQGSPPALRYLGIRGGRLAAISELPLPIGEATRRIDATGCWITPGFIDLHTHYDAEVELSPDLGESLRHGVTSVLLGSCSLSLAVGRPDDLADMFCRVEAIPYPAVKQLLDERKTWDGLGEYFAHLNSLPLGPNVASFVGHSAVRAHVMGLERSLRREVRPSGDEMKRMEKLIADGLDLGYVGASIQTLPWDKMGGSRWFRSRPLPSCFARWGEYRRITRMLRERGRVFQGVPNVTSKWNIFLFFAETVGLLRRPLKTTVISMIDIRANRHIHWLIGLASRFVNLALDGDFRWQALPEVFDLWADGIDLVVFEEFGAGAAALDLQDAVARGELLRSPEYRRRFRREWQSRLLPKAFHRNFDYSEVLACPDGRWVGKSFARIGRERGVDAVDAFLDLVAEHGSELRWYTVMGNDRPGPLAWIVSHPDILVGFSDAGAHLRQMAHYNFPLRLLRLVREAERRGQPIMPIERAVHRLTGELGDWLGLDAGTLAPGRRADLVVIDPAGLDERCEVAVEAPMSFFGGYRRLVRRNDAAVRAVLVNGGLAVENGQPLPAVGKQRIFGRLLRAEG